MTPEERGQSKTLVYQYLPSRYGMNPDDLRKADAIEVVVGQGAKPGGGGMLLGQKISDRVAADAQPAQGHRPALGLPPSRLDRPRRS
jgi:glutamate synthase domain-containing protein 2